MSGRERTVTWEDPLANARPVASMTGLEFLEAIRDGVIPQPPIARLLGFDGPVELSEGRAAFTVTPQEFHYNPIGVVHGGLAATLLDSAMGCAVQTTLPAGQAYTSLDLKVNFVRAVTGDTGLVRCEANVVHRGRTIATAEGRVVVEESGKLLAHGTATCLIVAANGA